MTEIKMAGKSGLVPFVIIGLAILAMLVYLLFSYTTFDEEPVIMADVSVPLPKITDETNRKVNDFVAFVYSGTNKVSANQTYIAGALSKMTAAINAVADRSGYNVNADLKKVEELTHTITTTSSKINKANEIAEATTILSKAMLGVQHAKFPALVTEASELEKFSASINPHLPPSNQKGSLKAFFSKAADLLKKMS